MELLNISVTVDQYGTVALDSVIGRDVSYLPYPGPKQMELLRFVAALTPSRSLRADLFSTDQLQGLMRLPALLSELAEGLQGQIDADVHLKSLQLALFS